LKWDIVNIFRAFTVFQFFLVSMFLLLHSQRTSKKNLLLAFFIILKALIILDNVLMTYPAYLPEYLLPFLCIGTSFVLLEGPTAYYIMVVLTDSRFSFSRKHLFHCIPCALFLGFTVSQYQFHTPSEQLELLRRWFLQCSEWSPLVWFGIYLQFALYGVAALRALSRGREHLYEYMSQSVERSIALLKFLIYDFIVVYGANLFDFYVWIGEVVHYLIIAGTAFNTFVIANVIVYLGLRFPAIFESETDRRLKYEKNLLSIEEKQLYAKKIKEHMEAQKPFLNPTLSLSELSDRVAIPSYVVSQVLNAAMNQNFYDFVNSYRVNESKKLMMEQSNNGKTLLEILYQSGFNSKSVFNSAFKKHAGITPREFKKNLPASPSQEIVSIAS